MSMSTDDSISEDVSSSAGFSHCSADGGEGKESETSLVSSEGTTAPRLLVSEDRLTASHTTGGTVQSKLMDTPALQNIRDICLTPEIFGHGKNLPFMNPSSIDSLRALMQEIRCSGVTNPDIWKDCEGRWLHLFQLVEKQYQEQILAQQEQYQCQIQLIQDEIKALVQIQNLHSFQPLATFSTISKPSTGDHACPAFSSHCSNNIDNLDVQDVTAEEPATTVLSSGYGTLFPWKTDIVTSECALEDEPSDSQKKLPLNTEDKTSCVVECQPKYQKAKNPVVERVSKINQQQTSVSNQLLTSWAQMNKLRSSKRNKTRPLSMSANNMEVLDKHQLLPFRSTDSQQNQSDGPSYSLRRSDSLISEASGLTYWQLHENDLYHLLPDSFDSGVHLLRDASMGFIPSLKEIYCNKQTDFKYVDVDGSLYPHQQVLDPAVNTRHSDCTSGFTSPSHFSSPSFSTPSHPGPRADTPLMPDSNNHGEIDCISDASSVCAARHYFLHPAPVKKSKPAHRKEDCSSFEDPVTLSLLRQNLREKHSRHVADLKAYYESEIQNLLDKLRLNDLPKDVEKSKQALSERCQYLEKALADATSRIQELEANNCSLEKKITEWSNRYAVAAATVKSLQKMLEDNKRSAKERDLIAARLKSQMQQLEEAAEKAEKESNENKTKREMEYKRLQELLVEYDSLVKKHEGMESNLVSTKNNLVDARRQISELKGIITKLESQVKQLEHENHNRVHYSNNNTQVSGAGLFHHPDLLLSPSKKTAQPDVIRTLSYSPISQTFDSAKSFVTMQPKYSTIYPHKCDRVSSGKESPVDITSVGSWNSDCVPPQYQSRLQDISRKPVSNVITPVMRALIELEETRATQSRAPWVDNSKATVGVVEQRLKVPLQEQAILQDLAKPQRQIEKDKVSALQRSLSKESHRSSSLPPPAQRNVLPANTPTKRETLRMPLSAKSSPKRCPTENFSTAFGHLMPREEHLQHSSRKWIPFTSAETAHGDVHSPKVNSQLDWDEWRQSSVDKDSGPSHLDRQLTLAEAERLFDELTQEKMQVEAALSRMPGAGRQTMQTRLNEVALEKKLERLSQELGFLRMTLKKFHALHSSAKS